MFRYVQLCSRHLLVVDRRDRVGHAHHGRSKSGLRDVGGLDGVLHARVGSVHGGVHRGCHVHRLTVGVVHCVAHRVALGKDVCWDGQLEGCGEGVVRVLVMSHWHVEVRCMHGHASRKGETRQEMFHRHWHLVAAEGGSDVQLVVLLLFLATVGEFDKEWLPRRFGRILRVGERVSVELADDFFALFFAVHSGEADAL